MSPLAFIFAFPIWLYRLVFSPIFGHNCRFQPSCSVYALEVLQKHGGLKGGYFIIRRLLRCHPWGDYGIDNPP